MTLEASGRLAADGLDLRLRGDTLGTGLGRNLSDRGMPEWLVGYDGAPRPAEGPWTVGAYSTTLP
jgi:hypothetical protein